MKKVRKVKLLRIISVALVVAIFFCTTTSASASDNDYKVGLITSYLNNSIDEKMATEISYQHMIQFQKNVIVRKTDVLYDFSNNITGYCVSFTNENKESKGYVLISKLHLENPIVEFSTEGGSAFNTVETTKFSNNSKTYFFGADDFYVDANDNSSDLFDVYNKKTINKKNIETKKINQLHNNLKKEIKNKNQNLIRFSASARTGGGIHDNTSGSYKKSAMIYNIGAGSSFYLMNQFGNGNICSPVAATNIMRYWSVKGGYSNCIPHQNSSLDGAQKAYSRLATLMSTSSTGGTSVSNIKPAISSYISERGYSAKVDEYWLNWWSDFTRDIDRDLPILVNVHTDANMGHSVFAYGYVETTGGKYLQVYDGWNDITRYLSFDGYYSSVAGMSVKVS